MNEPKVIKMAGADPAIELKNVSADMYAGIVVNTANEILPRVKEARQVLFFIGDNGLPGQVQANMAGAPEHVIAAMVTIGSQSEAVKYIIQAAAEILKQY